MIKTKNLTKKFGDLTAVDNLNLHVKKGEIFGLIGPNGAGKTTAIKMMVGILPPTSGSVEIAGHDIQRDGSSAKKLIGYIPDVPYVYPHMTGREFLYFVAALHKVRSVEKKIAKLLDIYPVSNMVDGYFKDFSRGTKQKLSILAALLHDPKVLIIDEPILGLDPKASRITKELLVDFRDKGGTVFICTHTLTVVQEICDRIGILDKSKLVFDGTITKLKNKLKTKEKKLERLYFIAFRE
ncbi:MAG: ABC transporter ATP-binding protein [Patescibacteria group bacterium]